MSSSQRNHPSRFGLSRPVWLLGWVSFFTDMMRRILVDHARARNYQKRGGHAARVTFDEGLVVTNEPGTDFVALDDALAALAKFDERKSRVIEMRFFGGLSVEETASVLNVSPDTVMSGAAIDPAWSPNGDFIVYSGLFSGGTVAGRRPGAPLQAVRADGQKYDLPPIEGEAGGLRVSPGGYRFLDQRHLVYRPVPESLDFWLIDLITGDRRQITHLANKGHLRGFDIAPDGKHIVFDRTRQNSDVVLIDLPKK